MTAPWECKASLIRQNDEFNLYMTATCLPYSFLDSLNLINFTKPNKLYYCNILQNLDRPITTQFPKLRNKDFQMSLIVFSKDERQNGLTQSEDDNSRQIDSEETGEYNL